MGMVEDCKILYIYLLTYIPSYLIFQYNLFVLSLNLPSQVLVLPIRPTARNDDDITLGKHSMGDIQTKMELTILGGNIMLIPVPGSGEGLAVIHTASIDY
jgi:hypothetical protein